MKNYYEILGISEDSSSDEIRKSYYDQLKINSTKNISDRERLFSDLNEAYFALSNEGERAKYDLRRSGKVSEKIDTQKIKKSFSNRRSDLMSTVWIFIIIGIVSWLASIIAPGDYVAYPVQCNDWLSSEYPYTEKDPPTKEFSSCKKPEAMERQIFKVNVKEEKVIETSPDTSDVISLSACTVQDKNHWSCGSSDFSSMPGGILASTRINKSENNFSEYGLSAIIFVTEDQWNSINGGKTSICGSKWCDSEQ